MVPSSPHEKVPIHTVKDVLRARPSVSATSGWFGDVVDKTGKDCGANRADTRTAKASSCWRQSHTGLAAEFATHPKFGNPLASRDSILIALRELAGKAIDSQATACGWPIESHGRVSTGRSLQ